MILGIVEDRNKTGNLGGFCADDSLDYNYCTLPGSSPYNHNRANSHTFRIKSFPGAQIGIRVEVNTYSHAYDDAHYNSDVEFYINGEFIERFNNIYYDSVHSDNNRYDLYLYLDETSDNVTEQILDEIYATSGTHIENRNLYTIPETDNGTIDLSFTCD